MSHLVPPQEEKKTTGPVLGKLPVDHEYPPQQSSVQRGTERAAQAAQAAGDTAQRATENARYLVPPQEEKVNTSAPARCEYQLLSLSPMRCS